MNQAILTKRLRIEPWAEEHADDFFELIQDEGFHAFPINSYKQPDLRSARAWIRESISLREKTRLGKWGIWEREGKTLLGMGGLTPWTFENEAMVDLTYRFRQSAWGMGYGTESAVAMIEHGFKIISLAEITATITPDNLASAKVAARIGMKLDRRILLEGVPTDLYRLRNDS